MNFGRQWARVDRAKRLIYEEDNSLRVTFDSLKRLNTPLSRENLIEHFMAQPLYAPKILKGGKEVNAVWGSMGVCHALPERRVKCIGIDADSEYFVNLFHEHLLPQLEAADIEFIEEFSGTERAHYLIAVDNLEIKYTNALIEQWRLNTDISKSDWFNEIYPFGPRENALFRLPFGYHIRSGGVNFGQYNDFEITNIEEGLEALLNVKPIKEEKLLSLLKAKPKEKQIYEAPEVVLLKSTELLKVPEGTPEYIANIGGKCQAINRILENIKDNDFNIEHIVGVGFSAMAEYSDKLNNSTEGWDWINEIITSHHEEEGHWTYYWGRKDSRAGTPSCAKWEEYLDCCHGCPYKGEITTPRQLYNAKPLETKKIGDIRVMSLEDMRDEVFTEADQIIDASLENLSFEPINILLEPPQNSGKSMYSDGLAVRLAKQGKRVCISCSTIDVALQHKAEIERIGGVAFVLLSFEGVMNKFSGGITCPFFEEIKNLRSLGVESSYYKKEYCKTCPFYEECNFPKQYSLVQEDKYPIIIIQHAHMACVEVMKQIMRKHFDILIVDESFIDFLTIQLIPTLKEVELLEALQSPPKWMPDFVEWLKEGKYPGPYIEPSIIDLKPILDAHREAGVSYRMDQFLRQYNEGEYMHPTLGVMKFSPLPDIPVRVITDATPTIEELEIVLNTTKIKRIGGSIVTDPTVYHPDNKVYQTLDGKASKSEMLKKEKLYEYLEFIGDKMLNEYKDLTALITVFAESEQDTWDWIIRNYPSIAPRIQVNHMAVGSNAWADINVQFVLAGPYVNLKQLKEQTFKLKFILNYWRRQSDLPIVNNIYPSYVSNDARGGKPHYEPIKRIHRDGIHEYEQFRVPIPNPSSYDYLVFLRLVSKSQQAGRIRHKMGKRTDFWFFDHRMLPSFLVTNDFQESEIFKRLSNA